MTEENRNPEPLIVNLKYFILLFFMMAWVGLFPSVLIAYWYFMAFPFSVDPLYLVLLIPVFLGLYGIALLSSLAATKLGIWLVYKRISRPIPGSYPLTMENPHVRAFILKGNIKNFGRWLFYFPHWDFLRAIWLRQMGIKIGKKVKLGHHILDDDFLEFGDNSFLARETGFSGHLMDHTHLTLHPTKIGKNCILKWVSGAVGGIMGDYSILETATAVMKGQICRGNAIYKGVPCKKVGNYSDLTAEDIEKMKKEIRSFDKINYTKMKNAVIKISNVKLFLMKIVVVFTGCILGLIFPFLYGLLVNISFLSSNTFLNIFLIMLIPFIFIASIGFFVVGTILCIKLFLMYYDKKVEIPEGTYELDDPRAKIFKIKYFLRLFGLRIFHGTPFKIADTMAMKVWGNVKIGKTTKLEDAYVDPQYLEIGDYCQIALAVRIHTHDIVDGKLYIKKVKLGNNVIIGPYVHIKPGVEVADGSVLGIAAWLRKNLKTKHPALWIGKPAFELPLSFLTKSAHLEGKYID